MTGEVGWDVEQVCARSDGFFYVVYWSARASEAPLCVDAMTDIRRVGDVGEIETREAEQRGDRRGPLRDILWIPSLLMLLSFASSRVKPL